MTKATSRPAYPLLVSLTLHGLLLLALMLSSFSEPPKKILPPVGVELWSAPPPMAAPAAAAAGTTHTVRPGETLYRIGQKYHVAPDQLRKWNKLKDNTVGVGQKLIVSQP